MRMILKNPEKLKDLGPGDHMVELVGSEPDLVFELCDSKMSDQARSWRVAVMPLRSLAEDMQRYADNGERPTAEKVQSWINTLNIICP